MTPRMMAGSVSRASTATRTMTANQNSPRVTLAIGTSFRGFALCHSAAITIAASVASGRLSKNGARNSSVSTTSAAFTTFESWLFALAASLAAVFDKLPPTTMPLVSPAPTLDTPTAMNS